MKPWIVMRAHNDMPLIARTLKALSEQSLEHDLLVLDNDSEDGTAAEARKYTDHVVRIPRGEYVPGRALNLGMRESAGEWVFFLNSDCVPGGADWLETFLRACRSSGAAALFCRQTPHPEHHLLYRRDVEDAYGDGRLQARWRHCFSMAASAVRRSVWERFPFDETLRYSEDIEWTWRLRREGLEVRYVPEAAVTHSHDYTLKQWYRRQFGEGYAEALIFDWNPWRRSALRYSLLPCARQIIRDLGYCLVRGRLLAAAQAPVFRMVQHAGRRRGFISGLRQK